MKARAATLFQDHQHRLHVSTDRMFAGLMVVQWVFALGCAIVVSPRTWSGAQSAIHPHLYAAVYLGGLLTAMPVYLALRRPGERTTRHAIAISQVLFSALLIHLTGGRIETHFHIFGSLAFIAFYRDLGVLLTTTVVVAIDHLLRSQFWPQSVFGVISPSPWRWLEHAAWVVFEDVFLVYAILRANREVQQSTTRQAALEASYESVEREVIKRTKELEVARDSALRAARTKAEFLSNMSHEIRTPMNGVLGFVQLLRDTPLNAEQLDYVSTIEESGDSLLTIINDILDLSKVEAGKLQIESTSFAPRRVMESVGKLLSKQAESKGLRFTVKHDLPPDQIVEGDPTRLRQILLNLAGNALKFTSEGEVVVHAAIEREDEEEEEEEDKDKDGDPIVIAFTVRDTGVGISPEQQQRLFQPFEQADASTTRRFGGTGLGLVICRHLADLMGGSITLQSAEHLGSRFTVRIPFKALGSDASTGGSADAWGRHASSPTSTSAATLANEEAGHIRLRILLAEDNLVNQRVAVAMLQKHGHQVDLAVDGEQAVRAFRDGEYDLILMDAQMPELDGFGATAKIRATLKGQTVPIVALTAHAIEGYRQKCLDAGMSDYLTKPIVATDLERVLRTIAADRARWTDPTTGIVRT